MVLPRGGIQEAFLVVGQEGVSLRSGWGQPSGERFVLQSRSWETEAITLGMHGEAEVHGFACLGGLGYLPTCS